MYVRKSNGKRQKFKKEKIEVAIIKAAERIDEDIRPSTVSRIATQVEETLEQDEKKCFSTAEISSLVEDKLMASQYKMVARSYIEYRHDREVIHSSTDQAILSLIANKNEELKTENSNKNASLVTTQRDYEAGIINKDFVARYLYPKEVTEAHKKGIIHQHDTDYLLEPRLNCVLCNLEDMLQNGTVLNDVMIEKPHSFWKACTIATQVVQGVSAANFGM